MFSLKNQNNRKAKIIMKKSHIITIIFVLIIVLLMLTLFLISSPQKSSNETSTIITGQRQLTSSNPVYNLNDTFHSGYNYIINPEKLTEYDFLGVGITSLGDTINDYLQEKGYYSQQLEITDISNTGSIINITLNIPYDNSNFIVSYDNLANEYSFSN